MFVVLDTNIWLAELGLRSGAAAAAKFYLSRTGAVVVIPEVVRLEVTRHLSARMRQFVEDIQGSYRQLLMTFGTLREIVMPTDTEIAAKAREVFDTFDVAKREIPFGIDSARSSFLKAIEKQAPSDKTQEFKDGVIWSDCLGLLAENDVVLVTSDKAFYRDRTFLKGLAENLKLEASGRAHSLRILPSLSDLLESIREPIRLDEEVLLEACLDAEPRTVRRTLAEHGFTLNQSRVCSYRLFATEDPRKLFFEYTHEIECTNARGDGRSRGRLVLKGDGTLDPTTLTYANVRNFGEQLTFTDADGADKNIRHAVMFGANIVLGHREVSSSVRFVIDEYGSG